MASDHCIIPLSSNKLSRPEWNQIGKVTNDSNLVEAINNYFKYVDENNTCEQDKWNNIAIYILNVYYPQKEIKLYMNIVINITMIYSQPLDYSDFKCNT